MRDAAEIGSGAMMYIPSFIKIGSGIQKLMIEREFTDTKTAWR
jgi:tetrahydrodipicolinate N-succinyltransferase